MHLTGRDESAYDVSGRPARLEVGVVGAGRVGSVLGAALARAGHRVVAVSAVSEQSRERAELLLPGVPVRDVREVVETAELVLLAVPDDALPGLVEGLVATGSWQAGQIAVHTSGRYGVGVLQPTLSSHVIPLAVHPAMTFSGTAADLLALNDCCFGVTAPAVARPVAEALVVEMGGEPVWVEEEDRPRYHAALSHGSNHLVTLVAQSMQVLADAGVSAPDRVLAPLLSAALDNALRRGDAALTGPVARGDAGTVAAHLEVLSGESEDIYPAYVAMARATAERALAAGRLTPLAAEALLDVLGAERWGVAVEVANTREALALARGALGPGDVAVVMTMGALHEGHATLIRTARERAAQVIVTIFLNPLQFGHGEDLSRYPRTIDDDLLLCTREGVDIVFAPTPDVVYPLGEPGVRVSAGPLGDVLEGHSRPGHFDGVLTVVGKLFHLTSPSLSFFGQKDAQQLLLIRRMVDDLDFPVQVVAVPTVREPDGLAMSSRNMYLTPSDREAALALVAAMRAGQAAAAEGPSAVRRAARAVVVAEPLVAVDYLVLVHPETLADVPEWYRGEALLAVAARVGTTRLIDNVPLTVGSPR